MVGKTCAETCTDTCTESRIRHVLIMKASVELSLNICSGSVLVLVYSVNIYIILNSFFP